MEGKPRCKKCGRVLTSPSSVARGMGSVCAGTTAEKGKAVLVRIKRSLRKGYPVSGSSERQAPLFPGVLPKKQLSKREIYRRQCEERRLAFETHRPFQCGMAMPKNLPLIYEPLEDGQWKENQSGRVIPHERLQGYLTRYRLI